MHYNFLAPRHVVFGWGRRNELGPLARSLGRRAFIVLGSRTLLEAGVVEELERGLAHSGVEPVRLAAISREPEVDDVDRSTDLLLQFQPRMGDLVLAVGGGSAIDLGKAVAALATNRQGSSVRDYLEGVGRGLQISEPPLPLLALPTTAGTGSEATKNAVISSYDPPFKKSLRSELMTPQMVLIDPELSVTVPPSVTAHTGMDAITQLIESYLSRRAQPIPQALSLQGLELALPAIVEAVENGRSRPAREHLAHAALLSGLALANSGLGLAHGVAAALGVHCRTPHGLACAVMLPAALKVNRDVREAELAKLAGLLPRRTLSSQAAAADAFLRHIRELLQRLGIPERLSEIGVTREQLPAIVRSSRGNSMNGNPRDVSDEELSGLLAEML